MTRSRNARLSRREMLGRLSAAAVAAPLVVRGAALGLDGATPPSERITVGSIGVGMMGRGHFRIFAGYPDVQLLALCDVDSWRREHSTGVLQEVYGARQPSGQFQGFKAYNDFRELLDRDDIDAVIVVTGERWHPEISVRAAKAGKDIYCEKPISLTIQQARTMAETVRRHNCVFQTGLQQRNSPEYLKAFEMVHAGRIGEVKAAYVSASGVSDYLNLPAEPLPKGIDWEMWLGPCPWYPYNYQYHHAGEPKNVVPWSCNRAFGAGGMTSGLVHNLDSAHAGLRKDGTGPIEITPAGVNGAPSLTFTTPTAGGSSARRGWSRRSTRYRRAGTRRRQSPFRRAFRRRQGVGSRRAVRLAQLLPGQSPGRRGSQGAFRRRHHATARLHRTRRPRADVEIGGVPRPLHLAHRLVDRQALKWDPVRKSFRATARRIRCAPSGREPWSI